MKRKKKEIKGKKKQVRRKKKKEEKRDREISLLIFAALAIAMITLFSINFNFLIQPSQNHETINMIVVFRWLGFADAVFIDDNPEFVTAKIIEANPGKGYAITELEPGKYYWKTNGLSPVQSFTIDSHVAIEIENESVENKGNIAALLEIFKYGSITGQAIVEVNQKIELNETQENTTVIGSQSENQ